MADEPVVQIASGRIRGRTQRGVHAFKGVPYAGPARGAGRFAPPAPIVPWTGVREADDYGASAIQNLDPFGLAGELGKLFAVEQRPTSEDCLFLNVWTPGLDRGRRPVMFWCHGGAFISGSGSSPWYDGANLSRRGDVVVVTLNHRLGALGYLHLADLGGERWPMGGVAGMLDIVAALEWVRDNIAALGGDPDNVTIFGESGGGAKVSVLMAMPAAQGLFHKAIIQSGPGVEMASRADATETAKSVLGALGIGAAEVERLGEVPVENLLKAQAAVLSRISMMSFANRRRLGFNPVVDGKVLPKNPFTPSAPQISANVPLMIGTNKDEMTLFFGFAPWLDGLSQEDLRKRVARIAGDGGDRILARYRSARPDVAPRDLFLAIATDAMMRMPSLATADRKVEQNAAPVFVYLFAWETPVLGGRLKSPHALEIPFVFDNLASAPLTGGAADRQALAERMSDAWIAFARRGDPSHAGLPRWPAYSAGDRSTMIFDTECRVEGDPFGAERTAWLA